MLTYKSELFYLSGPFNLNSLEKEVNDIYRLDDYINDGKQNISYPLFCSSAVSKCTMDKQCDEFPVGFLKADMVTLQKEGLS